MDILLADRQPTIEPDMSAVCIRYAPPGMAEAEAAVLHARVARRTRVAR